MHCHNLKGSHYQIGVQQGLLFRKAKLSLTLNLDAFQLQHGEASESLLRSYFPEVCEEIRGFSDTIGADYFTCASWLLCMGCCMYNLEQNIPTEIRGCTAFAIEKNGQIVYGRNNDLPPFLRSNSASWLYLPEQGNRFQITTSSLINGEEGMNEHGLAAAMTFVMTSPGKIRPGFNACFLVRYLLQRADSTKDAISMLMELPAASNCNILLADAGGDLAVVECTPAKKQLRHAQQTAQGRMICTVNGFTSKEMKPHDDTCGNDYHAADRYQTVMKNFPGAAQGDLTEAVKRLLRGEYGFLCQYDDEPGFETIWSSVFELKSIMIYRAEGDPRKEAFITDSRLLHAVKENAIKSMQSNKMRLTICNQRKCD